MDTNELGNYIKNNHLKIIVRPNSNKSEIIEFNDEKQALKVNIAAPADKNKANKEVIKFFSKLLKKRVEIKSGLTSKEKLLRLQ
ncbi:YggU family protein [Candidatus Woesearchaeota archaeon]|nr:YggU family protein [Candidatus Woesearchaeota archaeon]